MNYLFLAEGFETVEALTVADMLFRARIPLTKVSISDSYEVTTSHGIKVIADKKFEECSFSDADMLILPGGMPGTVNLENDERLCTLIKEHNSQGKNLAAICAAPRILGNLGLLTGKRACCFPGFEDMLLGANVTRRAVEVDGNCITSRGMGTVILFGAAIIEKLEGKELADKILNQIQWETSEK